MPDTMMDNVILFLILREILPKEFDTTLYFTEAQLRELQASPLVGIFFFPLINRTTTTVTFFSSSFTSVFPCYIVCAAFHRGRFNSMKKNYNAIFESLKEVRLLPPHESAN
jgi:hypothetical protein